MDLTKILELAIYSNSLFSNKHLLNIISCLKNGHKADLQTALLNK